MDNKNKENLDALDAQAWKAFYLARSARERASQLIAEAADEALTADALSRHAKDLWKEIRQKEGEEA